jgi:hypothetical protein
MSRIVGVLAAFLAALALGCGGERDRGINRNKDRPQRDTPADKAGK